jgi:hypothetical protein
MGRTARLGHADGTCSSSSKLLGPFHAERGGGFGERSGRRSGGARAGRGEANRSRARQTRTNVRVQ